MQMAEMNFQTHSSISDQTLFANRILLIYNIYICNIKINHRIYGIWQNDYLYVSKDIQRNNITYCFKLSDHDNNTIMTDRLKKIPILSLVCKCYINNDLRFESPIMETDIREIMKLYYRR